MRAKSQYKIVDDFYLQRVFFQKKRLDITDVLQFLYSYYILITLTKR